MLMEVIAVRDRITETFGTPIFVRHLREAVRSFEDEVNRDGSGFAAHPDHYDLCHLGTFDDVTGEVTSRGWDILGSVLATGASLRRATV